MTVVLVELPKRKRIKDRAAIRAVRKPHCERCGAPAYKEPHHIVSVGAGGDDVRENLVQLCMECHIGAHAGLIPKPELVAIVARRKEKSFDEIFGIIGFYPESEPEAEGAVPFGDLSVEKLFSLFCGLDEREDDLKWLRGEVAVHLVERGVSIGEIAGKGRCSSAQVRELIKTYRAFEDEGMRIPELKWYHHRLAANTGDPAGWIAKAAENGWPARQMREALGPESREDMLMSKRNGR